MTTKQSGIYRIKNLETGSMYIGQTAKSFASRWSDHRCDLKAGRHRNIHLQRSYNRHGKDAFEYRVLEIIPQGDMSDKEFEDYINEREIILIAEHDTLENGYNLTEGGGGTLGHVVSSATKRKLRKANLGKTLTKEHVEKIRAAQIGIPKGPLSEEHKRKLSEIHMGHVVTEATRKKISKSRMGKKGHPQSEATRRKISETLKKTLATSRQG